MAKMGDIEKGQAVDESTLVVVERGGRTVEQWRRNLDLKLWKAESPLPFKCCIFKAPEVLRRQKEQAYEPDVVSIGPFHRNALQKFKLVENVKEWYLKCLLLPQRQEAMQTPLNLDNLIETIKGQEGEARSYYSDPCNHIDQNDFTEMLLLDGCFLVELFRKAPAEHAKTRQDNDDPIFNLPCMLEYLYHDLLLLENQLPWFVLELIYAQIESGTSTPDAASGPLRKVVIDFFKHSVPDGSIFSYHEPNPSRKILHILDLIRTSLVSSEAAKSSTESTTSSSNKYTLPQRIPSATALSEVGVTFKKAQHQEGCILDINFVLGVFTIPPLAVDERTGPLFRNLIAFEQCYHSVAHKITSYAVLMDNLIDTNKDVDLLCDQGILANWLSADDATKFFNDLYTDTTVIDFVHQNLSQDVLAYHTDHWNRLMAILNRDYFGTPWQIISFFVAFVLLALTLFQTIYTIHPYYHPRS